MNNPPANRTEAAGSLDDVLARYLEAEDAGAAPERREWIERYPQFADELALFFGNQDEVSRVAAPLRPARSRSGDTSRPSADHTPSGDRNPAHAVAPSAMRRVGDYELIEEIARGGMGVVYKARDVRLQRLVALKMILAGRLASVEDLERFRSEARAAAGLDHPHIVPIYEVGEHEGQPFFAMRLVEGECLGQDLPRWTRQPRAAAGLVARTARAVHYAHQHGILHRDLKPANILVDADGEPHVTDFGLAKLVNADSHLTHSGAILGTPSYTAPEQASGKTELVTTAADVYSLGAILYALVTGRPPFRADNPMDTARQVVENDPVRPTVHNPDLDRDLETICLKCLEKEPARRYRSAEALAEDIERWLANEPIEARRTSRVERAWKWARRRPAQAGLVAVSTAAALALAVGMVWHSKRLEREVDRAEHERARAAANFRDARDAVEQMTLLAQGELADVPQMQRVRRALLEKALEYYQGFLQERGDDPDVEREASLSYKRVGDIHSFLGNAAQAEQSYAQAIALLQKLADRFPDAPDYRFRLAEARIGLGNLQKQNGAPQKAEAEYDRAAELLGALVRTAPQATAYQTALANCRVVQGILLRDTGRDAAAERHHREAVAIFQKLVDHSPDQLALRRGLAQCEANLASFLSDERRYAEAEALRRPQIDLLEELVRQSPDNPGYRGALALGYCNMALTLQAMGRTEEAETDHRRALELREKLVADFPDVPEYQRFLAGSANYLGALLQATDRPAEAEQAHRRARTLLGALADRFPRVPAYRRELALCEEKLAGIDGATGRTKEAEAGYHTAMDLLAALATEVPQVPEYRWALAYNYRCLGQLLKSARGEEAAQHYRQAIDILDRLTHDYPDIQQYQRDLAICQEWLASLLASQGAQAAADEAYAQATAILERLVAEPTADATDTWELALCYNRVAQHVAAHDLDEATGLHERALVLLRGAAEAAVPKYRREAAITLEWQAGVAAQAGRADQASSLYDEAMGLLEQIQNDFPADPTNRWELALCHKRMAERPPHADDIDARIRAYERALELLRALAADVPSRASYRRELASAAGSLGSLLLRADRSKPARTAYEESLATATKLTTDFPADAYYVRALANAQNGLAWCLVGCPDIELRDAARGVALARQATDAMPENGMYWNTLGVADYRAGEWGDAIEALNRSRELLAGKYEAFNTFFLAMAERQRGDADAARRWHERAIAWMTENMPDDEELRRFRAEAAELFSVAGSQP